MRYLYFLLALLIIAAVTLSSLPYWHDQYELFIGGYDIAYHMNSIVGMQRCGGFTLTNFWAPYSAGGTNIVYFPFFHILGLLILSLVRDAQVLSYWMSWVFFPLSLAAVFLFAAGAYGIRSALYSIVLLVLSPVWMEKQWGLPPQALVYVLTPLVFLALAKRRYVISVILTLCAMATHFTGLALLLFIFIYALHNREERKVLFIMMLVMLAIGSPLILLALHRVKSVNLPVAVSIPTFIGPVKESIRNLLDVRARFHVYMGWLAVAGIIACYLRRKKHLILPSYFLASFPLAWTGISMRYWAGPAIFIFSLLGGAALGSLHESAEKGHFGKLAGFVFFILVFFMAHAAFYYLSRMPVQVKTPTLVFLKRPDIWLHPRPVFSAADRDKIVSLVKDNVASDEFFWLEYSNNMNNEIAFRSSRSTVASISLDKNALSIVEGIKLVVAKSVPQGGYTRLDRINEAYDAYILADASKAAKVRVPKPLVTVRQIQWGFIALGALAVLDMFGVSTWRRLRNVTEGRIRI